MNSWNEQTNEQSLAQQTAAIREQARSRERLHALVRRVIREELSERDQLLVRLHWYRGKSMDEIARLVGTDRSAVYRRMDRIHRTIYDKLKYAVDFRFDPAFRPTAHETLQNAGRSAFAMQALDGIGARLQRARQEKRFSLCDVQREAGIAPDRMRQLESDGRQMMMTELSALCRALGIGAGELLFGDLAEEMTQ